MASQISKLGFKNLESSRLVEKLRQSEQELRSYKDHLEIIGEERTAELQKSKADLEHEIQVKVRTETALIAERNRLQEALGESRP